MIDTHCHLTFSDFSGQVAQVLERARTAGVRGAITIATTTADSLATVALAAQHAGLFASAGVHPLYADKPRDWNQMHQAALQPKCVAWGELGLDKHHTTPTLSVQRLVLDEQLERIAAWRAQGIDKPIIVHCRKAFAELLPILRASGLPPPRFVFHCFTGDERDAEMVLEFGAWVSFTGVLTYANAPEVRRAAKLVPLDRVMVETDSPFLAPAPERGAWPNEPRWVVLVARELARVHGMSEADLDAQLDRNAVAFFGPSLEVVH